MNELKVKNISSSGFRIVWHGREYFLDYENFPWFKSARVAEIVNVRAESDTHLYWPELDVDLSRNILEHPDRYPLSSKQHSDR